jgi:hypothetical protein
VFVVRVRTLLAGVSVIPPPVLQYVDAVQARPGNTLKGQLILCTGASGPEQRKQENRRAWSRSLDASSHGGAVGACPVPHSLWCRASHRFRWHRSAIDGHVYCASHRHAGRWTRQSVHTCTRRMSKMSVFLACVSIADECSHWLMSLCL